MKLTRGTRVLVIILMLIALWIFVKYFLNEMPAYTIEDMQVAISVDENRNCNVREQLKAVPFGHVDWVYYLFPAFSIITDPGGNKIVQYNRILGSSFDPNEKTGFGAGCNMRLYLKNDDSHLLLEEKYEFSYMMHASEVNREDPSSILLYLISSENRVQVNGITFSVKLPEEIDPKEVHFYLVDHKKQMIEISPEYDVDGEKITGYYAEPIGIENGFAIRVSGKDGIFARVMEKRDLICIGLTVLLCAAGFFVWFFFGRAKYPVIETVEFAPPFSLNCLEISWIYNGNVREEDVLAMFLYMAGKGYIRADKRYSFQKRKLEYVFFFEKEYDGDNFIEEKFMTIMFPGKKGVVYEEDLQANVGGCRSQFMEWVNQIYSRKTLYSKGCYRGQFFLILANIAVVAINFIFGFEPLNCDRQFHVAQMMFQTCIISCLSIVFSHIPSIIRGKKDALLRVVVYFVLSAVFIVYFPMFVYETVPLFLLRVILPLAVIMLLIWFSNHMVRRNARAANAMGRVLGYRKFLQHVEKARIETLMNDNPDLFYTVFSYTYVLDVSWKWLLDLEDIVFPVRREDEMF